MGTGDRASNKAEESKGELKQNLGEALDNDSMKNEGKRDEVTGKAKNAFEDAKDKVTGMFSKDDKGSNT